MKEDNYTKLRKFYSFVGFVTIVILLIGAVLALFKLFSDRDRVLMSNTYCHMISDSGEVIAWQC